MAFTHDEFIKAARDRKRDVPSFLKDQNDHVPLKRFNVYRNNIKVSLMDTLKGAFPVTQKLIGETLFNFLVRHYVDENPPHSPVMHLYGGGFADFLSQAEQLQHYPYVSDVARLEKARTYAYHAGDAASLTLQDLAGLDEALMDRLCFGLHPSLHLVESAFPLVSLWHNEVMAQDTTLDMQQAETALIIRPHLDVVVHKLSPSSPLLCFLKEIKKGAHFSDASEAAYQRAQLNHEIFDLSELLVFLFSSGCVTHFIHHDLNK